MNKRTDLLSSRVLIVDDEPMIRNEIVWRFGREGFTSIFEASSGREALSLHNAKSADLVITDIRMSNGTGVELMEELRKKSEGPLPVILAMTAYADLTLEEAYGHHVDAFFQKPFRLDDLVSASLHFLDLRKELARGNSALQALAFVDEMGQILTVSNLRLQRLTSAWRQGDVEPQEGVSALELVMTQNRQMLRFLADLRMKIQSSQETIRTHFNIADVLQNELALWKAPLARQNIGIRLCTHNGISPIAGDVTLLGHALHAMIEGSANISSGIKNAEIILTVDESEDKIIVTCEGPRRPPERGSGENSDPQMRPELTDSLLQRIAALHGGHFGRQRMETQEIVMLVLPVTPRGKN